MARLARVVVAGVPHHITERGNRRQQTCFLERIEQSLARMVRPNRRGPKPKKPKSQVW